MGATLDLLREMLPGKAMLTAEDVAKVLGRDSNRAGREAVAAGLRRGDLLPGSAEGHGALAGADYGYCRLDRRLG